MSTCIFPLDMQLGNATIARNFPAWEARRKTEAKTLGHNNRYNYGCKGPPVLNQVGRGVAAAASVLLRPWALGLGLVVAQQPDARGSRVRILREFDCESGVSISGR